MILDDIFSGLDGTTENKVFRRLLGPHSLLRKHEVTVVLATNSSKNISP